MTVYRRALLGCCALLLAGGLALAPTADVSARDVLMGVLAYRPAAAVQARWEPLAARLSSRLEGTPLRIRAMGYRELEAAIAGGGLDFVFTNPSHYLLLTHRNGLSSPLVTLVTDERGLTLERYGGVIFTRAGRDDLRDIADLRRRRIAAVTRGSLGGYQAQARTLLDAGIRLAAEATLVETGMPHDRTVAAVLAGEADAGFARTGVLEQMAAEGRLDRSRLKLLGARPMASFPLQLCTDTYPEWPIAAMPGVDQALARRVAAELLSIPHGGELARALRISGFTIPQDYGALGQTMRELRVPPFERVAGLGYSDVLSHYTVEVLSGALLTGLIVMLSLILLAFNRALAHKEKAMRDSAVRWRELLTALGEGVFGVDAAGNCTFVNPAARQMLGFSEEELLGRDQHRLFHEHGVGHPHPRSSCPILQTLRDGIGRRGEDWFRHKDGHGFPVLLTTAPTADPEPNRGAVVVFHDISLQRLRENELLLEATTDTLTGVANRRAFLRELEAELRRCQRFGNTGVLLMTDIDHFKRINDRHGHAVGDQILRHYAAISTGVLRETDLFGRIGGEEFAILLPRTDSRHARDFAERYRARIAEAPVTTDAGPLSFTISIGLTVFNGRDSSDTAMARADAALYSAKEHGRNQLRVNIEAAAQRAQPPMPWEI